MTAATHRGTVFLEDARVLDQRAYDSDQYILTVRAPKCAAAAKPGSFAHITCDPALPMRRPLSIMGVDESTGAVEFLYKIVGQGLELLSTRRPGEQISVLGPIGQPFSPDPARDRALLIGGGVGIPPMLFLADRMRADRRTSWQPLVLMGSEAPFPFETVELPREGDGWPEEASHGLALLAKRGVPSRLASLAGLPGCYRGYVTDLARQWIAGLPDQVRDRVAIFACGPTPMLAAAAAVAREWNLPCQVSLEEFMACGIGGCAGCTVEVITPAGKAMKRVCVDGPVFDATTVFPPLN